jgi:septal ring factor EnvC (AmiA/AmiB activator)
MSTISILNQVYEEIKKTETDMKQTLNDIKEKRQQIAQLQNDIEAIQDQAIDTAFNERFATETESISEDQKSVHKENFKNNVIFFINQ